MAEYIKKEDIEQKIQDGLNNLVLGHDAIEVLGMIYEMPSADVAPVRHGRWEEADWVEPDCHGFGNIRTPKAALRCSNCKNCFKKELLWKDNYCPNCGAKMDLHGECEQDVER